MTDSRPTAARPATLRAAVLASLVSGAVAGSAAFALLRAVAPPDAPPPAVEPAAGSDVAAAPVPDATSPATAEAAELEALRDALETAEAERSQLAGTLLALNRRAETLESRLAALDVAGAGREPEEGAPPSGEEDEVLVAGEQGFGGEEARGELDSLVAAGLDEQSAADIRRRRDEFALARLELFDQAAREGWESDSDRLEQAIETLEANRPNLREELGDEAYDRYLFEEGSDNRVGIASVIPGSAASQVGIVAGDVVLSYAGSRVFRSRELQEATRGGTRGESVQVSVLRDGQVVAVDVPRGPLGVTLDGIKRPPG